MGDWELNLGPWICKAFTLPLGHISSPLFLSFAFCYETELTKFPRVDFRFGLPASASKVTGMAGLCQ